MVWFVMLGLYFSCSSTGSAPQKSTAYKADIEEDLSIYRTAYDFKITDEAIVSPEKAVTEPQIEEPIFVDTDLTVTRKLDNLLEEVAAKNRSIKTIRGFTIQVFSNNNREMAEQAKRQVYHLIPDSRPEINFIPPIYKVRVGQFVDRLEAQKTLSVLKKEFPNATVNPYPIKINN